MAKRKNETEDPDFTTDSNAGNDAIQGTVANADVKDNGGQKAPQREGDQETN